MVPVWKRLQYCNNSAILRTFVRDCYPLRRRVCINMMQMCNGIAGLHCYLMPYLVAFRHRVVVWIPSALAAAISVE